MTAAVAPAGTVRRKKATETQPQENGRRGKHDLVVVESPTKAKTIGKYLGSNFRVIASSGHVRDLGKRKESWFELTNKSLKQLGTSGAPSEVVEALKPLVKREFKTKADLLKAARKYVSKKELEPHERELAKVAKQYDEIEGLNIARGWVPHYVLIERDNKGKDTGKRKSAKEILDEINKEANRSNRVFLATDPDREGESIAWHIQDELKLPDSRTFRITFNEITKSAVANALAQAGKIDMNRVQAQEARRFLDRIVGFPLSKLLQRKITRGLSAGRVQSVAVRLIVEREREIEAFKTEEYWKLTALLCPEELRAQLAYQSDPAKTKILAKKKPGDKPPPAAALYAAPPPVEEVENAPEAPAIPKPAEGSFLAECSKWNSQEFKVGNEQQIDEYVASLNDAAWSVAKIEQKDKSEKAQPPFTTSTLQQQANIRLHYTADRTMRTAQRLYEGVELGSEGSVALITYMRTDSTRVSNDALNMVRSHIQSSYGEKYLPAQPNVFKSGKSAQEAHEAIRPVDLAYSPQRVQPFLNHDQLRLYTLIYNRFVASQMSPAIDAMTNVEVEAKAASTSAIFKAQGRIEKFDGYRKVMRSARQDDVTLPALNEQQPLHKLDLFSSQHFTKPPARYNEASLVKALEKEGIGRPSTYATIIYKIQQVGYVKQIDRRFHATDLGKTVTDLLIQNFPSIMDMKFTSHFEEELDQIERKELVHTDVLNEFWGGFSQTLEKVQEEMPKKLVKETGEMCPKCGKPLVERFSGKTKKMFVGCSGWNKEGTGCDYIKPREGEENVPKLQIDVTCPNCGKPMVQRFGPRGPFLGCSGYPECKTTMRLNAEGKPELTAKSTEHKCEKCGSPMVIRQGRRGPFLACSAYPKCRNALDVDAEGNPVKPKETGIFCEKCNSPMIIKRGPRGPFLACSAYPKCKSYKSLTAELREQLKDILPPPLPKKEVPQVEVKETCPECGSPMKLRTSSRGPFLGCSKYPKCKGTRPLPEELLEQIG